MRTTVITIQLVVFTALLLLQLGCASRRKAPSSVQSPKESELAPVVEEKVEEAQTPTASPFKTEMRAVWLATIYGLDWPKTQAKTAAAEVQQQRELETILDGLVEAGFNTVFLQVRHRGDVIYPSKIEPFAKAMTGSRYGPKTYDPLEFAIEECHRRGLVVHAWITVFPLGQSLAGVSSKINRAWCIRHQGEWQLDPGQPEVRSYIAAITRELAENYLQLDGIHLDYVRYPERAKSFADDASYRKYGRGADRANWRRENISVLLQEVRETIHKVNPHLMLSCATLGKRKQIAAHPDIGWTAYEDVYQDVERWARDKSVDFVVPMMYYRDLHFSPFLSDWKQLLPSLPIVPGLGVYRATEGKDRWPVSVIANQIGEARELGFPGICFYREGNIAKSPALRKIVQDCFAEPVMPALFCPIV